jgi:peptide/nickel transport system permease protein
VVRYLIRRLLWAGVLFIAVTLVTYIIFFVVPANPAQLAAGKSPTPDQIRRVAHYLGTDQPVYVQYLRFLRRLVFDHSLGYSFSTRLSVNNTILHAAPVTASLVFGGVIVWMLISVPIGVMSALRPRSVGDRIGMGFVLVGVSAHPVWIGLIFSYIFGFRLGWTPIQGYCTFLYHSGQGCGGPVEWFRHLILPWITFAILFTALYVRMIRATVMEVLGEDYVRTAYAKGGSSATVLRSHVLRNAALPIVSMLGLDIAVALGGAIFTESVYGLPGLGQTALSGLTNFDLPTTEGVVVFAALVVIVVNLIVDIAYTFLDPRVRLT